MIVGNSHMARSHQQDRTSVQCSIPNLKDVCADEAKDLLTKIAMETSLRYAIHLITSSSLIAARRKAARVEARNLS